MFVEIGAKIKKAREEKFLSQAGLGAKLGLTATAINYYEKGKRKISIDDLLKLSEVLKKPVLYFLPGTDEQNYDPGKTTPNMEAEIYYNLTGIAVLGNVQAGQPAFSEQNIIGTLPVPQRMAVKEHFALQVKGDSMTGAGINDGDLVLIRRQTHADFDGQIICALVDGEETTLKIFHQDSDGNIRLAAANPAYPDLMLAGSRRLSIQGVYAGVYKFPPAWSGQKL
jgi:repressor LexA